MQNQKNNGASIKLLILALVCQNLSIRYVKTKKM